MCEKSKFYSCVAVLGFMACLGGLLIIIDLHFRLQNMVHQLLAPTPKEEEVTDYVHMDFAE